MCLFLPSPETVGDSGYKKMPVLSARSSWLFYTRAAKGQLAFVDSDDVGSAKFLEFILSVNYFCSKARETKAVKGKDRFKSHH